MWPSLLDDVKSRATHLLGDQDILSLLVSSRNPCFLSSQVISCKLDCGVAFSRRVTVRTLGLLARSEDSAVFDMVLHRLEDSDYLVRKISASALRSIASTAGQAAAADIVQYLQKEDSATWFGQSARPSGLRLPASRSFRSVSRGHRFCYPLKSLLRTSTLANKDIDLFLSLFVECVENSRSNQYKQLHTDLLVHVMGNFSTDIGHELLRNFQHVQPAVRVLAIQAATSLAEVEIASSLSDAGRAQPGYAEETCLRLVDANCLRDDVPITGKSAIAALEKLAQPHEPFVVAELLHFLRRRRWTSLGFEVLEAAFHTICRVGEHTDITNACLHCLPDALCEDFAYNALQTLEKHSKKGDEVVVAGLVKLLLESRHGADMKERMIGTLARMSNTDDASVIDALVHCLRAKNQSRPRAVFRSQDLHVAALRALLGMAIEGHASTMEAVLQHLVTYSPWWEKTRGQDSLEGDSTASDMKVTQKVLQKVISKDGHQFVAAVLALVGHPSSIVRSVAVDILKQIAAKGDTAVVCNLLAFAQEFTLHHHALLALEGIAEKGDQRVVCALLADLDACRNTEHCNFRRHVLQRSAIRCLARIADRGDKAVIAALSPLITDRIERKHADDFYGDFKHELFKALPLICEQGDCQTVDALLAHLNDSDGTHHHATLLALSSLVETATPAVVVAVGRCLSWDSYFVRMCAVVALLKWARTGHERASHRLVEFFDDHAVVHDVDPADLLAKAGRGHSWEYHIQERIKQLLPHLEHHS